MRCPTLAELPPPPPPGTCTELVLSPRFERIALVGILLLALGLRVWGIGFGLPQRYHIDEPPYVLAALNIANGNFHIPYPYNSPNIFQFFLTGLYGVWYALGSITNVFDSPTAFATLYQRDPTGFYLIARGFSAVVSTGTVLLIYLLGCRLRDGLTGLIAAAFLAVTFSHGRDAHYAVTDTLVTGLVVASLLGTVLYAQLGRKRHLALASLAGGAAVGLKYLPAPVLIPPLLALMLRQDRTKDFLILLVCGVFGYTLAFPALILDFNLFLQQWAQVWNQASAPLGGIQIDAAPPLVYYVKTFVWGIGLPMTIMAMVGGLLWGLRQRPCPYACIIIFSLSYLAGISMVGTAFARYVLPLVPVLVLFAALGFVTIMTAFRKRLSKDMTVLVGAMICMIVCVFPLMKLIRHNWLLTQIDTRTLAQEWIEHHVPEGTRIAVQWYGPTLSTLGDPEPGTTRIYELIELTPFERRSEWYRLETYRAAGVSYIVVNSWNKEFVYLESEQNRLRQEFMEELKAKASLIAQFDPLIEGRRVPFVFEQIYGPYTSLWSLDRPGPVIEIYSLAIEESGQN